MTLTIEIPDEVARGLERIAEEQHKTLDEWASAQLSSLAPKDNDEHRRGSPEAILQAMRELPRLRPGDIEALEAAIAGRPIPGEESSE